MLLIVFDIGFSFMEDNNILTFTKALLVISPLLIFHKAIATNIGQNKWIVVFFVYSIILLFLSSEFFLSSKNSIKVLPPLLYFFIGLIFLKGRYVFTKFINYQLWTLVLISVLSALGYIFKIGNRFNYGNQDIGMIGLLRGGNYYPAAIMITIAFVMIQTNFFKEKKLLKYFYILIISVVYIFILLTVRRTAILLPIIGIFSFLLAYPKLLPKSIKLFSFIILLFSFFVPFFINTLSLRFQVRADAGRFDEDFYESEARYGEVIRITTSIFSFEDIQKSLIGRNVFAGGMSSKVHQRMDHTDYGQILGTTGLIGLFLYFLIYVSFFQAFRHNKKFYSLDPRIEILNAVYFSILVISLAVGLNGSIFIVSFRIILFMSLGAILGQINYIKAIGLKRIKKGEK